jgi:VWFA-related protein
MLSPACAQQGPPPQDPPAAAGGAPSPASPGSPGSNDQQPPVFRTGTSTVRVDVTVTDRSGQPVRTLTADDFEVFEDDRPQRITSFRLVDATGAPTDEYSLPIRNPRHAAAEAAREDVRVFVIFWDDYHIGQFQSALRAREQLKRFVLEAFGPTDLVAVVEPLTPIDAIRFTRDRRALAEQIHRLQGRRGVYLPPRRPVEQAHLRERQNIEVLRAQVTATALEAVMLHLGSIREGRKSLIFVSETLGPVGGNHVYSSLIRSANHTNTALYAFDPRGLQIAKPGASTHMLRALAQQSGADAYASNDMLVDLRRVVDRSSAYYLIGYAPEREALDGKYRKISVRVKQRGVDVRARSGYWQPHAGEMARARAAAAAAALPQPISTALTQITPENSHRPIELWAGFTTTDAEPQVTVAWAPRSGFRTNEEPAWIEVKAAINGESIYEGRLDDPSVSFPAAAGEIVITATARNADGDILDREQRILEIPENEAAPLALSTPFVLRARTPNELRALDAGTGSAAATREFVRTDRLRVRIAPFGAAAKNAILKAVLLGARGVRLVELPMRTAHGYHEVDLPLASVAQGEFLIRLEALSDEHKAEALVAFRVR